MSAEEPGATAGHPRQDHRGQSGRRRAERHPPEQGSHCQQQTRPSRDQDRSIAEWVSLGISSAIVLGLVALVSYLHFSGIGRPPMVEVTLRLDATWRGPDAYYIPVGIANVGDRTGQDVRVRVSLVDEQGQQESSEFSVPFLAGGATAHATAAFSTDPARGRLAANVLGYREP